MGNDMSVNPVNNNMQINTNNTQKLGEKRYSSIDLLAAAETELAKDPIAGKLSKEIRCQLARVITDNYNKA